MTTWTLKAADHQHRTAVTACDTERQAGKQRIVIVVQPKRAFAFAFGLTCGRGVDGIDFAVFASNRTTGTSCGLVSAWARAMFFRLSIH